MTFEILKSGEYLAGGNQDVWSISRKYGDVPPTHIPVVEVGTFILEDPPPGYKKPVMVLEHIARRVE
jgi:hypothetical protein